ncbi:LytTR family transcriptional regulator DNA-binding domain-containing protein [Aquimarina rhabdastrellae]
MHKYFYYSVLILFVCIKCNAQEFVYEHFGVDEGLPSSEVYDLFQDKEGYIWFATDKGISRYNGYEFKNFSTADGLTGNVVLRFYPQQNGQIWCYSYHNRSLFYFDEIFQGFKAYRFNNILNKNLRKNSVIKSIYLDTINSLHIGGYSINGELIIHNDGTITTNHSTIDHLLSPTFSKKSIVLKKTSNSKSSSFFFTSSDTNSIKRNTPNTSLVSSHIMANWLINNKTGVFMHNNLVEINTYKKENICIKNEHSPIGIKIIDSTQFFIGYEFGGGKFVNKKGEILKEFLKDKSVTNFLIDHEGGYWFTTLDSGVYYVKNPSIIIHDSIFQNSKHVNSLAKTHNNELLIGFKNGRIIKLLKDKTSLVIDQPERNIHAFVEHDSIFNKTYLYNFNGLKKANTNKRVLTTYILKLSEPINNTIFASSTKHFYKINKNGDVGIRKSIFRVHDVCIWNNDTLIGTPSGIFKFDNENINSLSNQSKLYNYRTDDIDVDTKNDILFVATQGAGVIVNDKKHIYNITKKDGLNSNIVNEIYIENDTTIWVCTNKGLNKIEFCENDKIISGISKKEGLLSNEVEDLEIINDTVWVGSKQGLCYFHKNQLISDNYFNPYLKLQKIHVNGKSRELKNSTSFTYKENDISFELEGISFANNNDLYYQYSLNNDSNWSYSKDRMIHFSSLSPGKYNFKVKMCIGSQNCSEKTITHKFSIQPPFWKTGWFTFLCLLFLGSICYLFFKIRVLTYNKDITRELIRVLLKYLKRKEKYFSFRENGNEVRIKTQHIIYIKSAGNYIDICTENKTHTIRMNIGKFLNHVPDKLEYIRVHRSYIVRIDKITSKSKNEVCIGDLKLPVSQSYLQNLKDIHF